MADENQSRVENMFDERRRSPVVVIGIKDQHLESTRRKSYCVRVRHTTAFSSTSSCVSLLQFAGSGSNQRLLLGARATGRHKNTKREFQPVKNSPPLLSTY